MTAAPGRALAVLLGVLAVLLLAAPARAHVGGGAAGSNYDARVLSVVPAVADVSVRVLSFGDDFEVVARGAAEVLVQRRPGLAQGEVERGRLERPAAVVLVGRQGRRDAVEEVQGVEVGAERVEGELAGQRQRVPGPQLAQLGVFVVGDVLADALVPAAAEVDDGGQALEAAGHVHPQRLQVVVVDAQLEAGQALPGGHGRECSTGEPAAPLWDS